MDALDGGFEFSAGDMRSLTQDMHRTWPHCSAMTGFEELDNAFKHEGQVLRFVSLDCPASCLKWIVTRPCIEIGCGLSAGDEGQMGILLSLLEAGGSLLSWTSGVRDGVQKEGSVGFAACEAVVSRRPEAAVGSA